MIEWREANREDQTSPQRAACKATGVAPDLALEYNGRKNTASRGAVVKPSPGSMSSHSGRGCMTDLSLNILIRRVDLLTLRLFLTIIEERNLGRAAIRENIAPSAVTKRIHDFEEVLGFELFHREPKGVVLSSVGHAVAAHVRGIFDTLNDIRADISE